MLYFYQRFAVAMKPKNHDNTVQHLVRILEILDCFSSISKFYPRRETTKSLFPTFCVVP